MNDQAHRERLERLRPAILSVLHPESIYGSPYRFQAVREFLRQTNLLSALQVMAVLNAVAVEIETMAGKEQTAIGAHIGNLLAFLFPKSRLRRAIDAAHGLIATAMVQRLGFFTPLSPWACSALTDACLRHCNPGEQGARVWPPSNADYFTRILLSFQKELTPERRIPDKLDLDNLTDEQFTEFTRNQLRANWHRLSDRDTTRIYALFEVPEVGDIFRARAHREPNEWFTAILGLSPREYRAMLVTLVAITVDFTLAKPDVAHLTINVEQFVVNMTDSARQAFRRLIGLAEIDLLAVRAETAARTWSEALFKNNSLLRRQLLRTGPGTYLVLDRGHFVTRFFHGLIHVLQDAVKESGQMSVAQFRSDLGYLFEGYVQWWLKRLFGPEAEYFFGEGITPGKETDAVVVLNGVACVVEVNHHWLNLTEAFEASPTRFASVVTEDFGKALRAAKSILERGLFRDGRRLTVETILPITVLPESMPVTDLTVARFRKELLQEVPESDGVLPRILPCQILSQDHLEYFDRVWDLPKDAFALIAYLTHRSGLQHVRFGPLALDRGEIKANHRGNTWGQLSAEAEQGFREIGPTFFRSGASA
jgi:hypothetical protein